MTLKITCKLSSLAQAWARTYKPEESIYFCESFIQTTAYEHGYTEMLNVWDTVTAHTRAEGKNNDVA